MARLSHCLDLIVWGGRKAALDHRHPLHPKPFSLGLSLVQAPDSLGRSESSPGSQAPTHAALDTPVLCVRACVRVRASWKSSLHVQHRCLFGTLARLQGCAYWHSRMHLCICTNTKACCTYRRCKHQIFSQLPELTQIALNLFDCLCVSLSKEPGVAVTVANAQATTLT